VATRQGPEIALDHARRTLPGIQEAGYGIASRPHSLLERCRLLRRRLLDEDRFVAGPHARSAAPSRPGQGAAFFPKPASSGIHSTTRKLGTVARITQTKKCR
jgi:hypothetical protein